MSKLGKINWKKAPFPVKLLIATFLGSCVGLVVGAEGGISELISAIFKSYVTVRG